jgi:hypothetical protein
MNKRTYTCTVAVFLALLLPCLGHSSPIVRLDLPSATILHQDTFALNLFVDLNGSDFEIFAFGFDLIFDPSQFTPGPAIVATPFEDLSNLWSGTDVAGSAFPGVGGDDILLAVLTFKALLPGNFSIGILSDLNDPFEGLRIWPDNNGPIDLTSSVSVTVSPVLEPATLTLLAAGLASLAAWRRRTGKATLLEKGPLYKD